MFKINLSKLRVLFIFIIYLFATMCASQIGDSCETSSDCATGQICDTSFPDGYCTIFDCEDDKCPDEAVCIDFSPFFYRNCMKKCDSSDDCREGYTCIKGNNGKKYCGVLNENTN